MARVPLIQEQDHPEFAEVIEKYRCRPARQADQHLSHAAQQRPRSPRAGSITPTRCDGRPALDGRLREIVIIRMGHLTGSQYVLRQHVPSLALADGLTLEECDALADWRATKLFSESERAVLAYADTMTRDITVPDAVFAEVKRHFDDRGRSWN